jgi:hypothetical protein
VGKCNKETAFGKEIVCFVLRISCCRVLARAWSWQRRALTS